MMGFDMYVSFMAWSGGMFMVWMKLLWKWMG